MISANRQKPGPVLRIRVERKEGKWRVVKRIKVPEMTIPNSYDFPKLEKTGRLTGFWFEAIDDQSSFLYRQILREPPRGVELFEDDGTISRVSVEPPDEYIIDLLLPDLPEMEEIQLFLEDPEQIPERDLYKKAGGPQPIAVFSVRENDSPKQSQKEGR